MNLLLDCDAGPDDALALQLLCRSGHTLVGVSTCFGGFSSGQAARQAEEILKNEGTNIPVCAGAAKALARERGPVHKGGDNWQGKKMAAGRFLQDRLTAIREPITLLATAPLTNVAEMLRLSPVRPARIVLMGGAIARGNRTEAAEFNFWCDPEAANEVLQSGCPITLLPLEAARDCRLDEAALAPFPPNVQALVHAQMALARRTGCGDGTSAIPYDAVAAAGLLEPAVFEKTRPCRALVDSDGALHLTEGGPVELVEYANPAAFFRVLEAMM